MDALKRLWGWWLSQFRKTSRLGKVVWVGAPLLLERGDAIWRNSDDCGSLFDAMRAKVSKFCWD